MALLQIPEARAQVVLNPVRVSRATPCETESDDALRIAALWTQARAALAGTEQSARGALPGRTLVRFVRELDPRSGSVLSESLREFDERDTPQAFFRSLPGDSLSQLGYWRRINDRTTLFYGPDAKALLSEEFVVDHCFRVVDRRDRAGLVGLAFQPVRERARSYAPADIRGTIWFDSANQELRLLDFVWTKLPGNAATTGLGGEVHFGRAVDGTWYVPRWHLRMPQDIIEMQGSLDNVIRVQRLGVVEEGGVVLTDSVSTLDSRASISGIVRDGNRRPLVGATVRVLGTRSSAETDSNGRYLLNAVPAGVRTVVADHPTYAPFGVRVGQARLLLDEGAARSISFRAPGSGELAEALCGKQSAARDRPVIRVTLIDSVTQRPVANQRLRLSVEIGDRRAPRYAVDDETDVDGVVTFCDVPPGQRLVLTMTTGQSPVVEFSLRRGDVVARTVRTVRP